MCLQAGPSEYNAVAHIDFDVEAGPSGYDAFADLVQMAVREDPSLADVAPGTCMLTVDVGLHLAACVVRCMQKALSTSPTHGTCIMCILLSSSA